VAVIGLLEFEQTTSSPQIGPLKYVERHCQVDPMIDPRLKTIDPRVKPNRDTLAASLDVSPGVR
jgi:hypothetical protein